MTTLVSDCLRRQKEMVGLFGSSTFILSLVLVFFFFLKVSDVDTARLIQGLVILMIA